jgi:hypothetical protein
MGDDDVAHGLALLIVYPESDAAGVNSHTLVDEKTSQTLFEGCVALTVKGAW